MKEFKLGLATQLLSSSLDKLFTVKSSLSDYQLHFSHLINFEIRDHVQMLISQRVYQKGYFYRNIVII